MNHLTDQTVIHSVLTQQGAPWKVKAEQAAPVLEMTYLCGSAGLQTPGAAAYELFTLAQCV